jgi:hypothetical protein
MRLSECQIKERQKRITTTNADSDSGAKFFYTQAEPKQIWKLMKEVHSLNFEVFRHKIWPFIDKRRDFLKFLSPTDDKELRNYRGHDRDKRENFKQFLSPTDDQEWGTYGEVGMTTYQMCKAFDLLRQTLKQTTWSRRQHEEILLLRCGMACSTPRNYWNNEAALECVKKRGIILVPVRVLNERVVDMNERRWFLEVIDFSKREIRHYDTSNSGQARQMLGKMKVRIKIQ